MLPILQRLASKASASFSPARHPVRTLIVTPTRELAAQVEESVRTYGKYVSFRSCVVYGGVGMQPQVEALARGIDILVATPGRLLDHVEQKTVDLRQVEILVLDEADRMLDMGFIHDIRRILALLPAQRQNLLFSATFPDEIRELARSFMKDPANVEVARRNTPAELVAQVAHPVDAQRKRELLAHLVKSNDWRQVLVFVKTKHGANRLAEQLRRAGVEADAIHGNKSQNARTRALEQFKAGEMRVLVATDIAARGLDIEALPHVVNYDLPHVAEDYVHRIGRTGRAGSEGEAVSLVSHEDRPLLAAIERLMNRKIENRAVPGFEPGSVSPERKSAPERQRQPRPQPRQNQQRAPQQRQPSQQPRRQGRPQPPRAVQAQDSAYEDQIREARARMLEEGEAVPPPQGRQPQQHAQPRPGEGKRRRRRGRRGGQGRGPNAASPARSSRQQQWDPRRSEPREPVERAYHQPSTQHVKVTHKPRRTLSGFVGALLGRKPEDSKKEE